MHSYNKYTHIHTYGQHTHTCVYIRHTHTNIHTQRNTFTHTNMCPQYTFTHTHNKQCINTQKKEIHGSLRKNNTHFKKTKYLLKNVVKTTLWRDLQKYQRHFRNKKKQNGFFLSTFGVSTYMVRANTNFGVCLFNRIYKLPPLALQQQQQ